MRLEGAENYYKSAITLPIFPTLLKEDLDYIVDKLNSFFLAENQ